MSANFLIACPPTSPSSGRTDYLLCEMDRQTLALVREALAMIQSNAYGLWQERHGPIGDKQFKPTWNYLMVVVTSFMGSLLQDLRYG